MKYVIYENNKSKMTMQIMACDTIVLTQTFYNDDETQTVYVYKEELEKITNLLREVV